MDRHKLQKKVTKISKRITAKPHAHAHFQTLTKTQVKFQKDLAKIVGGIVFTRYPVSICFVRS